MTLSYAILASLELESPCSGYDIVKQFDERISCFWGASHQQVYKELRQLKNQGWVSSETVIQKGRPNKEVYKITHTGLDQLITWINEISEPTVIREQLIIKILVGYLVPTQIIVNELRHRHKIHLGQLMALQLIEFQNYQKPSALGLRDKLQYLALRRGIRYQADWIAWCEEAIKMLEEHEQSLD